jgi:hypothetical protein
MLRQPRGADPLTTASVDGLGGDHPSTTPGPTGRESSFLMIPLTNRLLEH